MIEVKSSTKVKDYHYDDMAFQYHVFTGAGYTIRKCYMMVIDNTYVRNGAKAFPMEEAEAIMKLLPKETLLLWIVKNYSKDLSPIAV